MTVAYAYHRHMRRTAQGVFHLSSEFDAVKERIAFLRRHPELDHREPEFLELATKTSWANHDLAEAYCDERGDRAQAFLAQRQEEVAQFEDRLQETKRITQEPRVWKNAVEMDEAMAQSQPDRLKDELKELLPELDDRKPGNVQSIVGLAKHAAE